MSLASKVPFTLRVYVARLWLPKTLEPSAWIVRSYHAEETHKLFWYIACRFTDFDPREAEAWQCLLRRIEHGFLPGRSQVA